MASMGYSTINSILRFSSTQRMEFHPSIIKTTPDETDRWTDRHTPRRIRRFCLTSGKVAVTEKTHWIRCWLSAPPPPPPPPPRPPVPPER